MGIFKHIFFVSWVGGGDGDDEWHWIFVPAVGAAALKKKVRSWKHCRCGRDKAEVRCKAKLKACMVECSVELLALGSPPRRTSVECGLLCGCCFAQGVYAMHWHWQRRSTEHCDECMEVGVLREMYVECSCHWVWWVGWEKARGFMGNLKWMVFYLYVRGKGK